MGFPGRAVVRNPAASAGDRRDTGSVLGGEDPLEKGMATHFSIFAWRTSVRFSSPRRILLVMKKKRNTCGFEQEEIPCTRNLLICTLAN